MCKPRGYALTEVQKENPALVVVLFPQPCLSAGCCSENVGQDDPRRAETQQSQVDSGPFAVGNGSEALANQRWLGKEGHVSCMAGLQKGSRR